MAIDDFLGDDSDDSEDEIELNTAGDGVDSDSFGGGSDNSNTSQTGGGDSYKAPMNKELSSRGWQTKVDFGKPYVIVVRDYAGNHHYSKQDMVVMHDSDDWMRITEVEKDNFPKDHQVWERDLLPVVSWDTKTAWLNFCDKAIKQGFGDPNELLENDIEQLVKAKDEVYWKPGSGPNQARSCQVCGASTDVSDAEIVEIDLHESRMTPVCTEHSVEELAEAGLLS